MSMFSNVRSSTSQTSGSIFEFKAGRSTLEPGSAANKMKVVAEKTKGQVIIKQTSDHLIHFMWKNRENGQVVEDLIIFPDDTEFKEVKGCPDGKVYVLKFKNESKRHLFWLQDGRAEIEKNLCQKVNDALNRPPQGRQAAGAVSTERGNAAQAAASLAGLGSGSEELGALGGLDHQQLMQLLQFMNQGGSDSSGLLPQLASSGGAENGGAPVSASDLSNLQSLLSGLRTAGSGSSSTRAGPSIELSEAITGERVLETALRNQATLSSHLPQTDQPLATELRDTVRSPQFRQAADVFGHALQTGQMGPVIEQFNMGEAVSSAATRGDVLEFAKELTKAEEEAKPKTEAEASVSEDSIKEPEAKRGKPNDENDEMDLD